jgi:hypothetical protein
MTQMVIHAPTQKLHLRESPKDSVNLSLGFTVYDKDLIEWRTFYQSCHVIR